MNDDSKVNSEQSMWGILEILGHRKLAGLLKQEQILGTSLIRIDCYSQDREKPLFTQYYSPQSVFSLLPCSEEVAKKYTDSCQFVPVQKWELEPKTFVPIEAASGSDEFYEIDYDDDGDYK